MGDKQQQQQLPFHPYPLWGMLSPQQQLQFMDPEQPALVVPVLLAGGEKDVSSSSTTMKSAIRKPEGTEAMSISHWARKFVEENATEWLLKIAMRNDKIRETKKGCIIISFGEGYDIILLLNHAHIPKDITTAQHISVGICISTDGESEDPLSEYGRSCPANGMWEHVKASLSAAVSPKNVRVYLDTTPMLFCWDDTSLERKRVIHLLLKPENYVECIERRDLTEADFTYQKRKAFTGRKPKKAVESTTEPTKGKEEGAKKTAAAAAAAKTAMAVVHAKPVPESLTGRTKAAAAKGALSFNPKEYLLLAKAFDGQLSKKDLKVNASYFSEKELNAAKKLLKKVDDEVQEDRFKSDDEDSDGVPEGEKTPVKGKPKTPKKNKMKEKKTSAAPIRKKDDEDMTASSSKTESETDGVEEEKTPKKRGKGHRKGAKNEPKKEEDSDEEEGDDTETDEEKTPAEKKTKTPKKDKPSEEGGNETTPKKRPGRPKGSKRKLPKKTEEEDDDDDSDTEIDDDDDSDTEIEKTPVKEKATRDKHKDFKRKSESDGHEKPKKRGRGRPQGSKKKPHMKE